MKDGEIVTIIRDSEVSIVNLDLNNSITLQSVRLLDGDLNTVKEYVEVPIVIDPLKKERFIANWLNLLIPHFPGLGPGASGVPEENLCFLIEWEADVRVAAPAIGGAILFLLMDGDEPWMHRQLTIVPHEGKVIEELRRRR